MTRIISVLIGLSIGATHALAARPAEARLRQETFSLQQIDPGPRMNVIIPGLMQIGVKSNYFLRLADQIDLDPQQRTRLEQLFFDFQMFNLRNAADRRVAEAELQRLLTRESIDIDAVGAKVKEAVALESDVQLHQIESLLEAIAVLTHEQHLKLVALVREAPAADTLAVP
jgi:Spy/CpxP family protein refolding chaperone